MRRNNKRSQIATHISVLLSIDKVSGVNTFGAMKL